MNAPFNNSANQEDLEDESKKNKYFHITWEGNVKMIIEMAILMVGIGVCGRYATDNRRKNKKG